MTDIKIDAPCCPDWDEQTSIINSYIAFTSIRSGHDTFLQQGGKPFAYCPWCGRKVVADNATATPK